MKKTIAITTMTMTALALVKAATAENRIQYSMEDAAKAANKKANTFTWTFSAKTSRADDTVDASTPTSASGGASGGNTSGGESSSRAPVSQWNADGTNKITGTLYDEDGYDQNGWSSTGINKNTGTRYDSEGYDQNGWTSSGYNKITGTEVDEDGFDKDGWKYNYGTGYVNKATGTSYDQDGFNHSGKDADGYDRNGWKRVNGEYVNKETGTGVDSSGLDYYGCADATGWNTNYIYCSSSGCNSYQNIATGTAYDSDGYNSRGWNADGINKETGTLYDTAGYDARGYGQDGYNKSGYDRNGYDRDGFNQYGWNSDGYDSTGYNYYGFNADGNFIATGTPYTPDGYDQDGYDSNGNYACAGSCCTWHSEPRDGYYETSRTGSFGCSCGACCYPAGTPIALADGSTKPVENVTYDDELKVWNFDEGKFDHAKPIWIKVPEVADRYNYLRFSDGSVLKTINQHRIFNVEAGKFTYPMTDETPVGTHTLNAKGEVVELLEKKVVEEKVTYYNIITYHHLNCFAGSVLTSCRLNNLYPIKDLKFVKDDRKLTPYEEFSKLDRKWYDGLRLSEQPKDVNRDHADDHGDKSLEDYALRLIKIMKA